MSTNRTVYHVVPDATSEQWAVTQEENDSFREQYRTKGEAVAAARTRARELDWSEVKVHGPDGDVESETAYFAPRQRLPVKPTH